MVTGAALHALGSREVDLCGHVGAMVAANGGRRAVQSCLTNSFTGDTLVLMADGSKKPIKDVKLGDKVGEGSLILTLAAEGAAAHERG